MADSLQVRKERYRARIKRLEERHQLVRFYIRILCLRHSFSQKQSPERRQPGRWRREIRIACELIEKTCAKCEISKPRKEFSRGDHAADGRAPVCKTCAKDITAAWREIPGNRERGVEQMQAWRLVPENKARHAATHQIWKAANPERLLELSRQLYARKKDDPEFRTYKRRKTHAWERAHPENVRQRVMRRKGRKKGIPQIDVVDVDVLYERDKALCSLCHLFVPREEATQDHIIPITKPGSEESYANSALAHFACNSRKGNKVVIEQLLAFYKGDRANMMLYVPPHLMPTEQVVEHSQKPPAIQLSLFE